jgi:hypothetical protein
MASKRLPFSLVLKPDHVFSVVEDSDFISTGSAVDEVQDTMMAYAMDDNDARSALSVPNGANTRKFFGVDKFWASPGGVITIPRG